ncbi:MAG: 4Fe-4S dicluster domain-containing protein [Candidatus Thermoplasmatota archaeon]|jgi:ferredoxin like protein|uniref:ferredoxin family protein n=1 Tax=Ferroplasma sp. TaxID=2591003 RepID=UPI00038954D7|nr:4Fe-4S dicluster domain-containing protein [Ferroplasma sp.]EQB72078.1 MAG: ferredoxin like protein [Ferroplasma sp. Type II]MCL4311338.1 4Fe-4S dicluster domain-containing protein [Candidatus Thermoplasmatota archaeon]HIH60646.1 4Fe-4S ferredoxin [Ferroplasma sp.]
MTTEEKLYTLRYKKDDESHLAIADANKCLECTAKYGEPQPCVSICPANVFSWQNNKIIVSYENCVECGASRISCPYDNIIWKYPRFGKGIALRYG